MKTILAFGDSLTYGANPQAGGQRHALADRWPSTLEKALGGDVQVIAEGLGGRTTVYDDHTAAADRNGGRILPTLLGSHAPLDLVIIMLGTNDLKPTICGSALWASYGMRKLTQLTRGYFAGLNETPPQVLLVAPAHACETDNADVAEHFGGLTHVIGQSRLFAKWYQRQATDWSTGYFDAATVASASPLDGIHLDAANTRAIGEGMAPTVKSLLGL